MAIPAVVDKVVSGPCLRFARQDKIQTGPGEGQRESEFGLVCRPRLPLVGLFFRALFMSNYYYHIRLTITST